MNNNSSNIKISKEDEDKIIKYYDKIEGLCVTNIVVVDTLVNINYVESAGGGFSSVGDFDIELNELLNLIKNI